MAVRAAHWFYRDSLPEHERPLPELETWFNRSPTFQDDGSTPIKPAKVDENRPFLVNLLPKAVWDIIFNMVEPVAWYGAVCRSWRARARARHAFLHDRLVSSLQQAPGVWWNMHPNHDSFNHEAFPALSHWMTQRNGWGAFEHVAGGDDCDDETKPLFRVTADLLARDVPVLIHPSQVTPQGSLSCMQQDGCELLPLVQVLNLAMRDQAQEQSALVLFHPCEALGVSRSDTAKLFSMSVPLGFEEGVSYGRALPTSVAFFRLVRLVTGMHSDVWCSDAAEVSLFNPRDDPESFNEDVCSAFEALMAVADPPVALQFGDFTANEGTQNPNFFLVRGKRGSLVGVVWCARS